MPKSDDFFAGTKKPESDLFKFTKVGDCIRGTLVQIKDDVDGQFGKTKVYVLKADQGWFHQTDDNGNPTDEKVVLEQGKDYAFFTRNTIEDEMSQAKIGQIVAVRYEEDRKSKKGKMYKVVEARLGGMDASGGDPLPPVVGAEDDVPFN